MKIVSGEIALSELIKMADKNYNKLVKVVVDIEREIMAVDAELHADEEKLLLENGSKQANLWGINIFPEVEGGDWIEFDSMINIRPAQDNLSRGVDDVQVREKIIKIVKKLIVK